MTRLMCPRCGGPRSLVIPEESADRIVELSVSVVRVDGVLLASIVAPSNAVRLQCRKCGQSDVLSEASDLRSRTIEALKRWDEKWREVDGGWALLSSLCFEARTSPAMIQMVLYELGREGIAEYKDGKWRLVR